MIDGLKPYPATKDSGVAWLADVPAHWEVRKLRHVLRSVSKRCRPELPLLSVVREKGVIVRDVSSKDENHNVVPEDLTNYKVAEQSQFAMNKMKAWQGSYGVSDHLGIVSPAYFVFDIQGVGSPYFHRAVRSKAYVPFFARASDGVRIGQWDLSTSAMREIPFLVPPPSEQAAIVHFLDHADRRILRYIRAKEKLIALLEEQKQAIIQQAVTGRIDVRTGLPYPAYKSSGVEWLGNVPKHWDVAALRFRYSQCLGKMLDTKRITAVHLLPYLRNIDVQWDRINVQDLPTMDIPPAEYERYTVRQGDLLICEGGEVGRCALWSNESTICGFQKALHRLRPQNIDRDVPRFLYYALRTAVQGNAFDDGHESTIAHLTGDKLRAHRFPFPYRTEQESLVEFLDTEVNRVDQGITGVQREIGLLREYRARFIADVVSGKLDVRQAAAALPGVDPLADDDEVREPLDAGDAPGFDEQGRAEVAG